MSVRPCCRTPAASSPAELSADEFPLASSAPQELHGESFPYRPVKDEIWINLVVGLAHEQLEDVLGEGIAD